MRQSATSIAIASIMATVPSITLTPAEELDLGQRALAIVQSADPSWSTRDLITELAIELFVPDELIAPVLLSALRANPTAAPSAAA